MSESTGISSVATRTLRAKPSDRKTRVGKAIAVVSSVAGRREEARRRAELYEVCAFQNNHRSYYWSCNVNAGGGRLNPTHKPRVGVAENEICRMQGSLVVVSTCFKSTYTLAQCFTACLVPEPCGERSTLACLVKDIVKRGTKSHWLTCFSVVALSQDGTMHRVDVGVVVIVLFWLENCRSFLSANANMSSWPPTVVINRFFQWRQNGVGYPCQRCSTMGYSRGERRSALFRPKLQLARCWGRH